MYSGVRKCHSSGKKILAVERLQQLPNWRDEKTREAEKVIHDFPIVGRDGVLSRSVLFPLCKLPFR